MPVKVPSHFFLKVKLDVCVFIFPSFTGHNQSTRWCRMLTIFSGNKPKVVVVTGGHLHGQSSGRSGEGLRGCDISMSKKFLLFTSITSFTQIQPGRVLKKIHPGVRFQKSSVSYLADSVKTVASCRCNRAGICAVSVDPVLTQTAPEALRAVNLHLGFSLRERAELIGATVSALAPLSGCRGGFFFSSTFFN